MKTTKIFQSRFIDGTDGHDAAAEFNEAMIELADLNPKFERDGSSFWIFYQVIKQEPENIVEEHELEGEYAYCIDCPFIVRDLNRFGKIDERKKWATCSKTGERTHIETSACEIYHRLSDKERRTCSGCKKKKQKDS